LLQRLWSRSPSVSFASDENEDTPSGSPQAFSCRREFGLAERGQKASGKATVRPDQCRTRFLWRSLQYVAWARGPVEVKATTRLASSFRFSQAHNRSIPGDILPHCGAPDCDLCVSVAHAFITAPPFPTQWHAERKPKPNISKINANAPNGHLHAKYIVLMSDVEAVFDSVRGRVFGRMDWQYVPRACSC
jgi:hypothetical protein